MKLLGKATITTTDFIHLPLGCEVYIYEYEDGDEREDGDCYDYHACLSIEPVRMNYGLDCNYEDFELINIEV